MSRNTTPEMYDDSTPEATNEDLLENEGDRLRALLELGNEQDDDKSYRKIQIKRGGVLKLEFRVRQISENENQTCWRRATKYAPTKPGQPKVAVETNAAKYRSLVVYTATIDEDRTKIWDNRAALQQMNLMEGWEMVDRVLKAGEKSRVIDVIEEISGFDNDAEQIAGN